MPEMPKLALNSAERKIEQVDIEKAYEEVCEGKHPPDRLIVRNPDDTWYEVVIVRQAKESQ